MQTCNPNVLITVWKILSAKNMPAILLNEVFNKIGMMLIMPFQLFRLCCCGSENGPCRLQQGLEWKDGTSQDHHWTHKQHGHSLKDSGWHICPDSKVHGANMGPIRGRQDPGGLHVSPMNLAIWATLFYNAQFTTAHFETFNCIRELCGSFGHEGVYQNELFHIIIGFQCDVEQWIVM